MVMETNRDYINSLIDLYESENDTTMLKFLYILLQD